jgi:hypothetical protein
LTKPRSIGTIQTSLERDEVRRCGPSSALALVEVSKQVAPRRAVRVVFGGERRGRDSNPRYA